MKWKSKERDRHLDTPAEANRDKHINLQLWNAVIPTLPVMISIAISVCPLSEMAEI